MGDLEGLALTLKEENVEVFAIACYLLWFLQVLGAFSNIVPKEHKLSYTRKSLMF
jgi:hypothetical protein